MIISSKSDSLFYSLFGMPLKVQALFFCYIKSGYYDTLKKSLKVSNFYERNQEDWDNPAQPHDIIDAFRHVKATH